MLEVDSPHSFVRTELFFTGGSGGTKSTVSCGFWVHDTVEGAHTFEQMVSIIVAAVAAADPDDDNHERENRSTLSVISSMKFSKPLVEIEPAPIISNANIPGDLASPTWLPGETAMVVSLRSDFAGPAARGRVYWPHLTTSSLNADGTFATLAINRLALTWTDLTDELAVEDLDLVVVSRFHSVGGVVMPRSTPLWAHVSSFSINNRPDSQRRRGN